MSNSTSNCDVSDEGRDINMTTEMREQMIEYLIMWSGWSRELFDKQTDREIIELYEKYGGLG